MTGGAGSRELDQTPTWAVAAVCAVIVIISIVLEHFLHRIGKVFQEKKKAALYEALEKVKGELMVLGFISLILTFGQNYISRICIDAHYADTMLPCPQKAESHGEGPLGHAGGAMGHAGGAMGHAAGAKGHAAGAKSHAAGAKGHAAGAKGEESGGGGHRRLLFYEHRFLQEAGGDVCEEGQEPLISVHGIHQLHIFIFFLAIFHVLYSAITMTLGRLKIRGWKEWERLTDHDTDPNRFRLTHETSFVRNHNSRWTQNATSFYLVCFFRQFFRSVRKADYLTLRNGFITVHLAPGSKFDFQKYIKRSLEDDFKVVVGISPLLWASVVFYLLVNVQGWHSMFWLSLVPLIVILAVGTKLQAIISQMAMDIQERHAVVQGIPLVQVSDSHFWFSWPQLVLYLIHFVLFQNAFELTYFLWIWYEFGLRSCFNEDVWMIFVRVCLGVGAQFVCSYITLPLYALVTQMGSTMKRSIFDDQTSKALMNWQKQAAKKKETRTTTQAQTPGSNNVDSPVQSPSGPSQGTANIIASIDVQGQEQPDHENDLLTGT